MPPLDFDKYEGTGNDFVVVEAESESAISPADAQKLCDRRFGVGADGVLVVTKGSAAARAKMVVLNADGSRPEITPYLGALAHVVITDLTGTRLLHVHPMEMGGELMLHVEFPEAGDYRAFAQFIDGGQLRTVELSVRVL